MGFSTYRPEWQVTTPVKIPSFNPLIQGDVELDSYYVVVSDFNSKQEKIGEHQELCVTHNSLLRWYQKNLMPDGVSIRYEIFPGTKSGVVVKCTVEKTITTEESIKLCQKGYSSFPNNIIHVESIGEASCDNCSTTISKIHLANTAENRAFDRALIRYLSLDLDSIGSASLYSSSEEIGTPVMKEEEKAEMSFTPPQKNEKSERQEVVFESATKSSKPKWWNAPSETEKVKQQVPPTQPTDTAPKPSPAPEEKKKSKRDADQELIDKYKKDREEATKLTYNPQEYKNLMESEFNFMGSDYNGTPIKDMVSGIVHGNKDIIRAVHSYVINKPMQVEQLPVWKCLISYLTKNSLINFYRTGKFFIGKK